LDSFSVLHVRRELNSQADALANAAIDEEVRRRKEEGEGVGME
jgi:hypothetical protein